MQTSIGVIGTATTLQVRAVSMHEDASCVGGTSIVTKSREGGDKLQGTKSLQVILLRFLEVARKFSSRDGAFPQPEERKLSLQHRLAL